MDNKVYRLWNQLLNMEDFTSKYDMIYQEDSTIAYYEVILNKRNVDDGIVTIVLAEHEGKVTIYYTLRTSTELPVECIEELNSYSDILKKNYKLVGGE